MSVVAGANCGIPIIVYGSRRVRPDKIAEFTESYKSYSEELARQVGVQAVFAFADSEAESEAGTATSSGSCYYHVYMFRSIDALLGSKCFSSEAYHRVAECYLIREDVMQHEHNQKDDVDFGTLHIYGGFRGGDGVEEGSTIGSEARAYLTQCFPTLSRGGVRLMLHDNPGAGFIRGQEAADKGVRRDTPFFGFTKRYAKAGQVKDLCAAFQVVCDHWYTKIPGCICAVVFPAVRVQRLVETAEDLSSSNLVSTEDYDLVHDLRIFANEAAYLAHVDKSDADLTEAMQVWFDFYDTTKGFAGEMYGPFTNDPAFSTSSIKQTSSSSTSSGTTGSAPASSGAAEPAAGNAGNNKDKDQPGVPKISIKKFNFEDDRRRLGTVPRM